MRDIRWRQLPYRVIKNRWLIGVLKFLFPSNGSMVNLGGGNWYYPGWENIDYNADKIFVTYPMDFNRKKQLPYVENYVDIIFSGHLLYYLDIDACIFLLYECYRVLHHGGLLHISVIDDDIVDGKRRYDNITWMKPIRFTYTILYEMLEGVGFTDIKKLEYRSSSNKMLRGVLFDRSPECSMYVECFKI